MLKLTGPVRSRQLTISAKSDWTTMKEWISTPADARDDGRTATRKGRPTGSTSVLVTGVGSAQPDGLLRLYRVRGEHSARREVRAPGARERRVAPNFALVVATRGPRGLVASTIPARDATLGTLLLQVSLSLQKPSRLPCEEADGRPAAARWEPTAHKQMQQGEARLPRAHRVGTDHIPLHKNAARAAPNIAVFKN